MRRLVSNRLGTSWSLHTPLRALAIVWMCALGILAGCGETTSSTERGSIIPTISLSAATVPVTSWRATLEGNGTSQVRTGTSGGEVSFNEVVVGTYTLTIEGFDGLDVVLRWSQPISVGPGDTKRPDIIPVPVPPQVSITADGAVAAEAGPVAGRFTVSRTGSSAAELTVSLTYGGNAVANTDYNTLPAQVLIPVGAKTVQVPVTPKLDAEEDGGEEVIATISGSTAYELGSSSSAKVTITDAPIVRVVATDTLAGEVGADAGTFLVSRTGPTASALSVSLSVSGTAAATTDFAPLPVAVDIPAGQSSVTLDVTPVADNTAEGGETVVLAVAASPTRYAIGNPSQARVTIADTPLPTVTINAIDDVAAEAGPATATFRVSRTGGTATPLDVFFTRTGQATAGDYRVGGAALTSPVTIPAGALDVNVVVEPVLDALQEGDESLTLTLQANASYTLGGNTTASITMTDAPIVTIDATDANASEVGPDAGTIVVSRAVATALPLTVTLLIGGNATPASDYLALPTQVVIDANQRTKSITITPVADGASEATENVTLTVVADPSRYAVGTPNSASVGISDTPPPTITIAATTSAASEVGPVAGAVRITRSVVTPSAVAVSVAYSGSATNGIDYQSLTSPVTIPAGQASVTLSITPIPDAVYEGVGESATVTLQSGSGYVVGPASSATVSIADPRAPRTISTTPATATIRIAGKQQLAATAIDQYNATMSSGFTVTWTSLDPTIATVSAGLVTGVAAGSARIVGSTTAGGGATIADTSLITVVDPCTTWPLITIGSTFGGTLDGTSCTTVAGFTQLDKYTVTTNTQVYYSVLLQSNVSASLISLADGGAFYGFPSTTNPTKGLVVKAAGTHFLMIGTSVFGTGSYTVTTSTNVDPVTDCVTTDVTRQVSFQTALRNGCTSRDIRVLPRMSANDSITVTANSSSFPAQLELYQFSGGVFTLLTSATAPANGANAVLGYRTPTGRFVIARLKGPPSASGFVSLSVQ